MRPPGTMAELVGFLAGLMDEEALHEARWGESGRGVMEGEGGGRDYWMI